MIIILVKMCYNSILSIKNGTLSLTFVMLMRFFARLNIYYKTFTSRIGPMRYVFIPFISCCHNVDFCIAFLRQSANNYRHCSFCAQILRVVFKNKQ
jgi:hypothetical protein